MIVTYILWVEESEKLLVQVAGLMTLCQCRSRVVRWDIVLTDVEACSKCVVVCGFLDTYSTCSAQMREIQVCLRQTYP